MYVHGTQSSSCNPYGGQEEAADLRSTYRRSEVSLQQSQGEAYHTDYRDRSRNRSIDQGRYRSTFDNETVKWESQPKNTEARRDS